MRIRQAHIDAFGRFRDHTLSDLDHPVVVVHGPNESGKTTLFNYLHTLLYGFHPADPDAHPYAPEGNGAFGGTLDVDLADGTPARIHRSAAPALEGRLERDDETQVVQNAPLPQLHHVPRAIFSSLYALTLHDMAQVKGGAWEEVQERLLSGLHERDGTAGDVVETLRAEAARLWQPEAGHGAETDALIERLPALREALDEARRRDTRRRAILAERDARQARLTALNEERDDLVRHLRRAERLGPVYDLLTTIDELDERAGDVERYRLLPTDTQAVLDELAERLEALDERTAEQARTHARVEADAEVLTEADERVLEQADAIRTWGKRAGAHEAILKQIEGHRHGVRQARERLGEAAAETLTEPWDDAYADFLRELPVEELAGEVRAYEEARGRLREVRARTEVLAERGEATERSLVPWLAAAVVGAGVLTIGLVFGLTFLQVVGAAVLAVGVLQMYNVWSHNQRWKGPLSTAELDDVEEEMERRADAVAHLLRNLPLPAERVQTPDRNLVEDVRALRRAQEDTDTQVQQLRGLAQEVERNNQGVLELARACQVAPLSSLAETVARLETALNEAELHQRRAEEARPQLERLVVEEANLDAERRRTLARKTTLEEVLTYLGEGDLEAGQERLAERRQAAEEAAHHREVLGREHPNWRELQREIETTEEAWMLDETGREGLEQRLQELTDEREEVEEALAALAEERSALQDARPPVDVASEIAATEAALADLAYQRDRLLMLANVLDEADERFRRQHQPAVLRRASDYLRLITGGRYERLTLDAEQRIRLHRADGRTVPLHEAISQGTRDQVYLVLRLAIADLFDADHERLPLFLDEVFVNWDPERRRQSYDVLEELAADRQVFVFTCQPWFADELAEHLGATAVHLPEPEPAA